MVKLLLYLSLIVAVFVPWGIDVGEIGAGAIGVGLATYAAKLGVGAVLLGVFETSIAKMRVFRLAEFLGAAFLLGILAAILLYVSQVV